jgi:uncharacterized membrane protein YhiD involved in acid resistance
MLFIKRAYTWVKENLLIVGAAIGSIATLVLTLVLSRKDENTQTVLEHNRDANEARRKKDEQDLARTDKFISDMESAKEQAKKAGQELTKKQEEKLEERLEAFSSADTEKEKEEIAKDIQEVFPFMDMVDPSRFGKVE